MQDDGLGGDQPVDHSHPGDDVDGGGEPGGAPGPGSREANRIIDRPSPANARPPTRRRPVQGSARGAPGEWDRLSGGRMGRGAPKAAPRRGGSFALTGRVKRALLAHLTPSEQTRWVGTVSAPSSPGSSPTVRAAMCALTLGEVMAAVPPTASEPLRLARAPVPPPPGAGKVLLGQRPRRELHSSTPTTAGEGSLTAGGGEGTLATGPKRGPNGVSMTTTRTAGGRWLWTLFADVLAIVPAPVVLLRSE